MTEDYNQYRQIQRVYWRMVSKGLRNTDRMEDAADEFAAGWMIEEEESVWHLGGPDFGDRPALIFIVEAARRLCGIHPEAAVRLLQMAIAEIEDRAK